jgi:hypothetical protein
MEISIQEIHSYLNLVNEGKAEKINCPLNETDIVISKIDENNKVFFQCISCNTKFYLGINKIQKIKKYLAADLFLKKQF